jgi:hypothetical protein
MARRLRTISFVLFLMAVIAWACSYFTPEVYAGEWIIGMAHGTVVISWISAAGFPFYGHWEGFDGFRTDWRFELWRFPYAKAIRVPLWVPGLAGAAFAVGITLYIRHRVQVRREGGLCVRCGYDLRGSTERCPECALPIPHKTQHADAAM